MATVNQILHRKNSSGSYDTIYLKASMSNVTGTLAVANGGTGSTSASGALSNLGAASSSHNHNSAYATKSIESTVSTHTTDIADLKSSVSNGKAAVASAITDKGVSTSATATFDTMASNIRAIQTGITPSGTLTITSSGTFDVTTYASVKVIPAWAIECKNKAVGEIVYHSGYEWIIVHKTSTTAVLGLRYWYTNTTFGSNNTYKDSTLADLAATFENGLTTDTKQWLNSVTVNNVTAKVFIPSYEQVSGSSGTGMLSYYSSNTNRILTGNGTVQTYWTSSAYSSSYVWSVGTGGSLGHDYKPTASRGFRPHMEVNINF